MNYNRTRGKFNFSPCHENLNFRYTIIRMEMDLFVLWPAKVGRNRFQTEQIICDGESQNFNGFSITHFAFYVIRESNYHRVQIESL